MPKIEQLPDSLRNFSFINAATVDTGRDFHRDLDRVSRDPKQNSLDCHLTRRIALS